MDQRTKTISAWWRMNGWSMSCLKVRSGISLLFEFCLKFKECGKHYGKEEKMSFWILTAFKGCKFWQLLLNFPFRVQFYWIGFSEGHNIILPEETQWQGREGEWWLVNEWFGQFSSDDWQEPCFLNKMRGFTTKSAECQTKTHHFH